MNTIHGKHINGVIMPRRNVVMSTVLFMNVKKAKKAEEIGNQITNTFALKISTSGSETW